MSYLTNESAVALADRHAECVRQIGALLTHARHMLEGLAPPDISQPLRAYLTGVASYVDVEHFRARQLIDDLARTTGALPPGESVFAPDWSVKPEYVERFCPDLVGQAYVPRSNHAAEHVILLEPCPNEVVDLSLRKSVRFSMGAEYRPAFVAYASDDALAYVHPYRYQVVSRDGQMLWRSASPRALLRSTVALAPRVVVDGNVVIIQDRFDTANLSHFMFECVTRVLHYLGKFGGGGKHTFVLGSLPTSYHRMVLDCVSEWSGIPAERFFFPTSDLLLDATGKCIWFSDQLDVLMHPAQMAHPCSMGLLAELGRRLPSRASDARRVYVSRADAAHRRIVNESDLRAALEKHGFVSVELSRLDAADQVGLFRSAEIIVAPHGMGLTHIAVSDSVGRVVELFPPEGGTSAYAFVARSRGMQYAHSIGRVAEGGQADFTVDTEEVVGLLGLAPGFISRPPRYKAANLIPGSRNFRGYAEIVAAPSDAPRSVDDGPPVWGMAVRGHWAGGAEDDVVGGWTEVPVIPDEAYTLSAWIKVPGAFSGTSVEMGLPGWQTEHVQGVDLARRGVWQRVWTVARSPSVAVCCDAMLAIRGTAGEMVLSSCWQLERGAEPTAYVAT